MPRRGEGVVSTGPLRRLRDTSPTAQGRPFVRIISPAPTTKYPPLPKTNCAIATTARADCCAPLRRQPLPSRYRKMHRRHYVNSRVVQDPRDICARRIAAALCFVMPRVVLPILFRLLQPAMLFAARVIPHCRFSPEYSIRACWRWRGPALPAIAKNDKPPARVD